MSIPFIPDSAPFEARQIQWLNGFLAGLLGGLPPSPAPAAAPARDKGRILFLYGTQTGGAETLARSFMKQASSKGFDASVSGMDAYGAIDFSRDTRVALVTSTYGDGEMPDNAQPFWDHLNGASPPDLSGLRYSVLALGDSSYPLFCEAGKKFDTRLAELGAGRIHDRVDCDADYEESARAWFSGLLEKLHNGHPTS